MSSAWYILTVLQGSGPLRASNLVAALAERGIEARHHKGKGKAAGGAGGALANLLGRDAQEMTQEEDDAHWADLHTRDPHHKGKGKNAAAGLAGLLGRDPHHKGKGKNAAAGLASLLGRDPHHKVCCDCTQ
jgi:hypothetical protein